MRMEKFYCFERNLKTKFKLIFNSNLNFALEFRAIEFSLKLFGKLNMYHKILFIFQKTKLEINLKKLNLFRFNSFQPICQTSQEKYIFKMLHHFLISFLGFLGSKLREKCFH